MCSLSLHHHSRVGRGNATDYRFVSLRRRGAECGIEILVFIQMRSLAASSAQQGGRGKVELSRRGMQLYATDYRFVSVRRGECGRERLKEVVDLLCHMGMQVGAATYASLLRCCTDLRALWDGRRVHAHIIRAGYDRDRFLGNLLVRMYGKCGLLEDACGVFDKICRRNTFSWNIMIHAYAENGRVAEARYVFDKMPQPNVVSWNVLLNMYGKCAILNDARSIFDRMPQRNVLSWNAMIAAYTQNGYNKDALELFRQMQLNGVEPNNVTFVSVLDACAGLADVRESHASIIDRGFQKDVVVGNALVSMYSKCGSLDDARSVFQGMPQRNVVSWTAMIAAYFRSGHGENALELFREMQLKGVEPNEVTFTSILSGCSHAGLVDDGCRFFLSMTRDYDITPTVGHFLCLIDLLGRAGRLDEAEDVVNNMSLGPYAEVWMSLLGSCRVHGDLERGTHAAEQVFELDPKNPAPFVLLSNIYATAGKWDAATKVRKAMKDRGVKKMPGCSFIEVKKKVHEFVAGDKLHPQREAIHAELKRLSRQMEEAGYIPDTKAALCYREEVNKELILCYHSEKVAIAFGLISTLPGTTLYIKKNLRVCSDCHAATKIISKIVRRKIIVRDSTRFHHFEHGVCSCGEYW